MHYGTFDLSDEPLRDPGHKVFAAEAKKERSVWKSLYLGNRKTVKK